MKTYSNTLATNDLANILSIDNERVRLFAQDLSQIPISDDLREEIAPVVNASSEATLRAYLWAAAICHSTKGGYHGRFKDKYYKGWDYLIRAFSYAAEENEDFVSPTRIQKINSSELLDLLARYSTDTEIDAPDIDRRAEILNICAKELIEVFEGSVQKLLNLSENRIGGGKGAYEQLAKLSTFQDPLRKKSSAFLMTAYFAELWVLTDHENTLAMIDYHRLRLLCRSGCIVVHDKEVLKALQLETPVDAAIEETMRVLAIDISDTLSRLTQMPMFKLDMLLWAHARSCCRYKPICVSGQVDNESFFKFTKIAEQDRCVCQNWCPGAVDVTFRSIWEPKVKTEHY